MRKTKTTAPKTKYDPRTERATAEPFDGHTADEARPAPGPWDPTIQKHISNLIAEIAPEKPLFEHADVVSEIVVTALKAAQSQIGRGDLKVLSRAIRELRYAFKIFKPYRSIRKVTMFGSARTASSNPSYRMAKEFAKKLIRNGYMIITGAGPGIMQAGNEGAGPQGSFGINIRLPYEQFPNKFIAKQPTYIDCRYFFTRKLVFVKEASAAAFFPGGFGTLDEAFELLTLVQTGKSDPMPIVLVDTPGGGYWKSLSSFIHKNLLSKKMISEEDIRLFKIVSSTDEACREIFRFYSNFHSMRYVGETLVMRLQKPITDRLLSHLGSRFKDVLRSGHFAASGPLMEEANQPEIQHLPRLTFHFNRINNGRLRQLIDAINDFH